MRLFHVLTVIIAGLHSLAFAETMEAVWDPSAVRAYFDKIDASVKGGQVSPKWIDGGPTFWFEDHNGSLLLVDPEASTTQEITTRKNLSRLLKDDTFRIESLDPQDQTIVVHVEGKRQRLSLETKTIRDLGPAPAETKVVREMFPIAGWDQRQQILPGGDNRATLVGPNFGIEDSAGKLQWKTEDGTDLHPWFYAGDIWESSGDPWSPDGSRIVARRHDQRAVVPQLLLNPFGQNETVDAFSYWARAGQPLPVTRFSVFDVKTGKRVDTEGQGGPNTFAFFIDWHPDGQSFYVIRYNRLATTQELLRINAVTGKAELLLRDEREDGPVKWPSGPRNIVTLKDGGFLWRSDASGYFQWSRHSANGDALEQITSGQYDVGGIVHVDEEDGYLYAHGQPDPGHPYDMHLLRIPLDGGEDVAQLTELRGQHRASVSPDGSIFVVSHSHLDRPPRTDIIDKDGALLMTISEASVDEQFRRRWKAPEEFTARARGGAKMHGLIHFPVNFDPDASYPVIDRIYGGMQSQVSRRVFPAVNTAYPGGEYQKIIQYLNAVGFIVVTVDAPGTPGRGRDFNWVTYGTWPRGVLSNHRRALERAARSRPYMDLKRVGIVGNSWGGYMALRGLTDEPKFFKAGSASVPETDLFDHAHWIEWQI
ncbi:MAG: DPP IV N-terminal domain-containing protein, partial [Pseudomonadota bacterium]